MKRLLAMALASSLLFLVGCTRSENIVAVGDVIDIPSAELQGYTVTAVMNENVLVDAKKDAAVLLLTKGEQDAAFKKACLVVQTKETSLSYAFHDEVLDATLATGDVDGDKTDEIIVQLQLAASGGAGYYLSYVFKAGETIQPLGADGDEDFIAVDTGFSWKALENYEIKITNQYTEKATVVNIKDHYNDEVFDDTGKLLYTFELGCDTFFEFEPIDVDGDGVFEIAASQYTYLDGHADGIGNAKTVLKFNTNTQRFDVIDSSFEH